MKREDEFKEYRSFDDAKRQKLSHQTALHDGFADFQDSILSAQLSNGPTEALSGTNSQPQLEAPLVRFNDDDLTPPRMDDNSFEEDKEFESNESSTPNSGSSQVLENLLESSDEDVPLINFNFKNSFLTRKNESPIVPLNEDNITDNTAEILNISLQKDLYLVKLKNRDFKDWFEGANMKERAVVWVEITAKFNAKFNLELTSREVQHRYGSIRGRFAKNKLSESRRALLAEYFLEESSRENPKDQKTKEIQQDIDASVDTALYIARLKNVDYKERFEATLLRYRGVLWDEIAARTNDKFKLKLTSQETQARYNKLKAKFARDQLPKKYHDLFCEYLGVPEEEEKKEESYKRKTVKESLQGCEIKTEDRTVCFAPKTKEAVKEFVESMHRASDIMQSFLSF